MEDNVERIVKTIFCEDCQEDIPIEELEDGTVIVHCPKCIGECMLCQCHLVNECFPDTPKVKLRHPDDGQMPGI